MFSTIQCEVEHSGRSEMVWARQDVLEYSRTLSDEVFYVR